MSLMGNVKNLLYQQCKNLSGKLKDLLMFTLTWRKGISLGSNSAESLSISVSSDHTRGIEDVKNVKEKASFSLKFAPLAFNYLCQVEIDSPMIDVYWSMLFKRELAGVTRKTHSSITVCSYLMPFLKAILYLKLNDLKSKAWQIKVFVYFLYSNGF